MEEPKKKKHGIKEIDFCIQSLQKLVASSQLNSINSCCGQNVHDCSTCCCQSINALKNIQILLEAHEQERQSRREAQTGLEKARTELVTRPSKAHVTSLQKQLKEALQESDRKAQLLERAVDRELAAIAQIGHLEKAMLRALSPERTPDPSPVWISINDGLPIDGTKVVARSPSGVWFEIWDSEECMGAITHWRPAEEKEWLREYILKGGSI